MARSRFSSPVAHSAAFSAALGAALGGLLLASACGESPKVSGTVLDIWDQPIEGATVTLEGVVEQQTTASSGAFTFVLPQPGEARVMAGKDGYIKDMAVVQPPAEDADEPATIVFKLYPDPGEVGFYAIGNRMYHRLPGFEAMTRGTEVRAMTGLHDVGDVVLPPGQAPAFVFSSTLRAERLAQLNLQLHRLQFTQETSLPGVLGETSTDLNMWTAVGNEIPYDLVVLPSRDDFLIELRDALPPGAYAFHTQGALTSQTYEGLDKLPRELRQAYTFEIK